MNACRTTFLLTSAILADGVNACHAACVLNKCPVTPDEVPCSRRPVTAAARCSYTGVREKDKFAHAYGQTSHWPQGYDGAGEGKYD